MVYRYYHRLGARQKLTYRRSDVVTAIAVPAAGELSDTALAIGVALKTGDPERTALACDHLLRRICARLAVPAVRVRVLADRPANRRGELHGLYDPGAPADAPRITVWMRTARRRQVVAFRTFLRTLLHELCHHLDYVLLHLDHSFHTAGFYKRESSLYRQLLPPPAGK